MDPTLYSAIHGYSQGQGHSVVNSAIVLDPEILKCCIFYLHFTMSQIYELKKDTMRKSDSKEYANVNVTL